MKKILSDTKLKQELTILANSINLRCEKIGGGITFICVLNGGFMFFSDLVKLIKYPIKILSYAKNFKIKFFYPSTIFINNNYSNYSKIKKIAEKNLSSLKNKKHIINILRIDEVNTKQNLSLTPKYLPSFTELLNKKKNYQRKIFFEDK